MATTGEQTSTETQPKQLSRRERAYLPAELPDDFLCVTSSRPAQPPQQGEHREPHLYPMTYAPQANVPHQPRHHHHQAPQNTVGRLKLTISQAKLTKNYGLTRMDPYCRIRIGHSVYETPTDINGSKNPRWNKVFATNLPRGVTSIYVEIFNERYLALDDRVAWAHFELPEDLFNGETIEEWVPLNGRLGNNGEEGNINVIMSLQAAPPPQSYQLTAYGNQPVSMVPPTMPGAQMYYHGGYPPGYPTAYPPAQTQPPPQQQQPQQQGPVQPRIKEEEVQQLQEMFPTVDKEVIVSVLQASGGRMDPAVTNLLSMTTT